MHPPSHSHARTRRTRHAYVQGAVRASTPVARVEVVHLHADRVTIVVVALLLDLLLLRLHAVTRLSALGSGPNSIKIIVCICE